MTEQLPAWTKFAIAGFGGASGWMFVHPIDVLKVRQQLAGKSGTQMGALASFRSILAQEGFRGLYGGLSAALTRQATYTTSRVGLYEYFRDNLSTKGEVLPLWKKALCGLSAGGLACLMCCPVEVSLVRMQADGAAPPAERRNYKHVFDAFVRIYREEGLYAGWRGAGPTVARGMVVSMTQLATYDQAKDALAATGFFKNPVPLQLSASLMSGFIYCATSLPLDLCKVKMQNQRPLSDGTLPYKSIPQTMKRTAQTEGLMALWKGFPAYFARGGGHTITMFFFVERYRSFAMDYYGLN